MPSVKIDYVVSFSSEDPEHPANNLLSSDVKSKWLCSKGEPSCSVVLQLKSACKIDSITIGAYHVALIEVLVGLSERPNDPFQVLVPSCVLLSPPASRRGDSVECVRSFAAAQLAEPARAQRWDRVRVVCSQPYNKHCKYGLAFLHISSEDAQSSAPPACAAPALRLPLEEAGSSDDEFRPGELFAQYRREPHPATSTDAQIRQASSHALKNIADASTKLTKTAISKPARPSGAEQPSDHRGQRSLLYTDDDDAPHDRIDRVLQRHKDDRRGGTDASPSTHSDKLNNSKTVHKNDRRDSTSGLSANKNPSAEHSDKHKVNNSDKISSKTAAGDDSKLKDRDNNKTPQKNSERNPNTESVTASQQKRKRTAENHPELGPVCAAADAVLAGAVLAMSGYENPRRAALRAAALELGAQYVRDWEPRCTHLVCAFPNTPKLRAVRASRAATVAVRGEWLEECRRRRRRLPWRWFATEPHEREPIPEHFDEEHDSEGDTDDEIEKVLRQQEKKQRRDPTPDRGHDQTDAGAQANDNTAASHRPQRCSSPRDRDDSKMDAEEAPAADAEEPTDSDPVYEFVPCALSHVHLEDLPATDDDDHADSTDEDEPPDREDSADITEELPNFWSGSTFALSNTLPPRHAALLARYIRAYGGLVLQESEALDDSGVQYVVTAGAGGGGGGGEGGARRVTPDWVWRQHASRGGHAGARNSAAT